MVIRLVIIWLLIPTVGWTARTVSAERPIVIQFEMAQPTLLVFPEQVGSVIVALTNKQLEFKEDGPYLGLIPLDPTITGRFFVIGESGKLYTVLFKIGVPGDDVVQITTAPLEGKGGIKAQPFTVSSFLRALRLGVPIPEQQPFSIPPPALNDPRLSLLDAQGVLRGTMAGLSLTLRNVHTQALTLDMRVGHDQGVASDTVVVLSHWVWPPKLTLLAVAVTEEVLGPGQQTRLYAIFEKRP